MLTLQHPNVHFVHKDTNRHMWDRSDGKKVFRTMKQRILSCCKPVQSFRLRCVCVCVCCFGSLCDVGETHLQNLTDPDMKTGLWMGCSPTVCGSHMAFRPGPNTKLNNTANLHRLLRVRDQLMNVCVCVWLASLTVEAPLCLVGREEFISEVSNKTKHIDVWGKSNFNKIFGHIRLKWIDLVSDFLKPFLHSGEDAQLQILWSALRW